ncbi:MAG TPA: ABC transporter permease, partial [Thermoanaerobaculia bacterium]
MAAIAALAQDLRHALRSLGRSPLFTAVALLSLAVGIGANAAIFGLLDQVLLRPLPVSAPGRLALLSANGPNPGHTDSSYTDDGICFSYPLYRDLRDKSPAALFAGVLARFPVGASVAWGAKSEHASAELVSGNYFSLLGVGTVLGRPLAPGDDSAGAPPVVLLSYGAWHRRFGGDPGVLGRTLRVNGRPFTVAGVVEPGFRSVGIGEAPELFVPIVDKALMTPRWNDLEDRRSSWLNVFARLAPGVSHARAEAGMAPLFHGLLESEVPSLGSRRSATIARFVVRHLSLLPAERGISGLRDQFGKPLLVLMGMVGLLLLIACANLAGLLVARAASRQKEIAVRLALGAGRGRLVRQLLVESGLLALGGGLLGLVFAGWGGRLLLRLFPADFDLGAAFSATPDGRVLAFTLAVAVATGLAFGLLPALQATRPGLGAVLRTQGAAAEPGEVRLRKSLVVAQVAVSLLLLLGALVFSRSLANLSGLDPGFRPDHLMTFALDASLNGYREPALRALYRRVAEEVGAVPGVRSVAYAELGLLTQSESSSNFTFADTGEAGANLQVNENWVAPGFLSTLGVPLLGGREVSAADREGGEKVALVNASLARKLYGSASPLGRRLGHGSGTGTKLDTTIVGVVRDAKYDSLREGGHPFLYFPYTQKAGNLGPATFYVRTAAPPAALGPTLASVVRRLDPDLPVTGLKTMEDQVDESIFLDRAVST